MDSQNRVQKYDLRVDLIAIRLFICLIIYFVNASSIESFKMLDDHALGRPVYNYI